MNTSMPVPCSQKQRMTKVYGESMQGDYATIGAPCAPWNEYPGRGYWFTHSSLQDPAVYSATQAELLLPEDARIQRAFLLWNADSCTMRTCPQTSTVYLITPASPSFTLDRAYRVHSYLHWGNVYLADITRYLRNVSSGMYWVLNIDDQIMPHELRGGAWTMYVFYSLPQAPIRQFSFYAGRCSLGGLYTEAFELEPIQSSAQPTGGALTASWLYPSNPKHMPWRMNGQRLTPATDPRSSNAMSTAAPDAYQLLSAYIGSDSFQNPDRVPQLSVESGVAPFVSDLLTSFVLVYDLMPTDELPQTTSPNP